MSKILSSASKVAFLMLMVTACVGFFLGRLEAKDFMLLATGAAAFYYTHKGDISQPFGDK